MQGLDRFTTDCRRIATASVPLDDKLDQISELLGKLVRDKAFVSKAFGGDPPGKQIIHHDPQTDIFVLAHVMQPGVGGNPHSHAPSWAIYANARGSTHMREFQRTNAPDADHAELREIARYTIKPGDVRAYPASAIHAPHHDDTAWVIRVTGGDLDAMDRWRFRKGRDRIVG